MIIITGASEGLGRELAELYVKDGKKVIGLSRGSCPEGVDYITTDLITTDLLNHESIKKAAQEINDDSDTLEALINCAGVYSEQEISQLTAAEINRVFQTNVQAPMLLTSLLMDRIKKDGADIVNVASSVGLKAYEDQAAYGASKWAMRGFSANLQLELKNTSCRVISFCPGGFLSNLVKNFTGKEIPDPSNWMRAKDLARALKQTLDLPKNMEVSEIIINRKQPKG